MAEKKNAFKSFIGFFIDCKNELKKIIWPTQKKVFKDMGVVLVMMLIMGIFVATIDIICLKGLGTIMNVSSASSQSIETTRSASAPEAKSPVEKDVKIQGKG